MKKGEGKEAKAVEGEKAEGKKSLKRARPGSEEADAPKKIKVRGSFEV